EDCLMAATTEMLLETFPGQLSPAPVWRPRTRWQRARIAVAPLLRRPGFLLALAVVGFALLSALVPGLLSHADPYATAPVAKLVSPSAAHWFGTDELGRDLYSRVVYGSRLSVSAALLA